MYLVHFLGFSLIWSSLYGYLGYGFTTLNQNRSTLGVNELKNSFY